VTDISYLAEHFIEKFPFPPSTVQDKTPTGPNQYNNVFYLLIALKAVDVLYGLTYNVSLSADSSSTERSE
jgi:hypothetical protein